MEKQVAKLNYLKMAPRKVRLVANVLKGLSVNEAEAQLFLQPRRAAGPILKLLRSAVANAKNNRKLAVDKLIVENIRVDQGPMLERFLPRARGSASPIQKKMSHITLTLAESEKAVTKKFSIVVEKKTKKGVRAKTGGDSKKERADEKAIEKPGKEKPGIFKRFFRRKSV